MESQRTEVFSAYALFLEENIILSATSAVVLSALFVVDIDGIDGGGGSTRCYTHAKSGNGIEW